MKKATRSLLQGLLLTCLSASVLAASMDASNQEGINAGKSADGTTSADPNGYFDNYSSDAPQRGYYSGPTQTSSNIDVKGQTELSESDLGQTARESYVNNPADKLSYDSDMMKYSDEIRENANAITGVNGSQCVAQELNKTTYTTHSCEMATPLTQSCTRKATIVTTGSREEYGTQLVLNARDVTGKKLDNWWMQYDFVVPEDGTISSGTWEFLYPKAPGYHGDRLDYSIQAFGQTIRTKINYSGTLSIPAQKVTQGQVISVLFRYNTDGHYESGRDGTMNSLANGTQVLRITLPMQAVRDTVTAGIEWTDSCPADMGDAVKMSEVCSDPGGTRSVTVGGQAYSVYSDCWGYTTQWNVFEDDTNTCQAYIDDPNCSEGTRTCTQKIGNLCVYSKLTYQCAHTVKSTGYVCGSEFYCSDGSCSAMQAGQNQNFEMAVSQLAALAAAGKDFAGMDPNSVTAFTGKAMACRKSAAGFSNCCKSGGWGQSAGLAHCNTEEKEIGTGKEKKLVVKVGSYCSKKVLGVCLQQKEGYCVFDSKLARIVQEQGRRDQLGISFGSGESPDCRGIKVAELQGIKFDHIDFSDFYDDLNSNIKLPDQDALNQRITSDIQNSLKSGD
ncbi:MULTISPECIES: conjugal transfer protein TraN [Pantoea]|jgi:conjugal transfer mating pair stabilization protein TraN|uniref:Conjugal transfer protein TraN n=1 Tax=Pantoea brenneri TaxID=472694 RepID=A0A653YNV6_9GAMM|nr:MULTISPECIES: conjugal transfer protein TraN [Pantoea]MBZ6396879.1 conjugal transfer protein TraN [Pantoea sp.]MBZ6440099.1 conjugal transfer protein TraN [Pantoea sp.]MDH1088403.1 conjugal transfer protein TraN [Pantoea brenneri]MDU4129906.1 conjugal transfer protein TraN [Pantoea sp.]NUY43227.1 conjugal transfer protein TraN [Pantoea brenneri]